LFRVLCVVVVFWLFSAFVVCCSMSGCFLFVSCVLVVFWLFSVCFVCCGCFLVVFCLFRVCVCFDEKQKRSRLHAVAVISKLSLPPRRGAYF
jgi:hypothetical protein